MNISSLEELNCVDFKSTFSQCFLPSGWVMALHRRALTGLITISSGLSKDGLLARGSVREVA